jgi:hypothetical protein
MFVLINTNQPTLHFQSSALAAIALLTGRPRHSPTQVRASRSTYQTDLVAISLSGSPSRLGLVIHQRIRYRLALPPSL